MQITVLVGDMYSNPVAPGTAVYFRSSAGVVQPTVFTNKDGFGTVKLYSGNPEPLGTYAAPGQGDGYHYVVARTLGQGGVAVEDSTLILWSGPGSISNVSPVDLRHSPMPAHRPSRSASRMLSDIRLPPGRTSR